MVRDYWGDISVVQCDDVKAVICELPEYDKKLIVIWLNEVTKYGNYNIFIVVSDIRKQGFMLNRLQGALSGYCYSKLSLY